jgi:hypothetical protein
MCLKQKMYRKHYVRHIRFKILQFAEQKTQQSEIEKWWALLPNAARMRVQKFFIKITGRTSSCTGIIPSNPVYMDRKEKKKYN